MKAKYIILIVSVAFVLGWVCNYTFNDKKPVRDDFREKLLIDTIYVTHTDTLPVLRTEVHTKYVSIPVYRDSIVTDSVQLEVVQRTYSDDSIYTAYVSGVAVDSFPRLDSISVRQRNILIDHEIERTITKKRPLTFGLQTGAGYGITTKKPDIYIGIGLQWNF